MDDDSTNLRPNDPFNEMERSDIAPDIGREGKAAEKQRRSEEAADNLRDAEGAARNGLGQPEDNLDEVNEAEKSPKGLYSGKGKAAAAAALAAAGGGSAVRGAFKKAGPGVGILGVIFIFATLVMGVQFLQPFSVVAQFKQHFSSMQESAEMRSRVFIRAQLKKNGVKDPIKKKWLVFGPEKFKITEKQAEKLKAQGIEFEEDFEGQKALKFVDEKTGKTIHVVADPEVAKSIGGDVIDFDTAYKNNETFYRGYNAGSKAWRGQFANMFGTGVKNFLKKNKLTRNAFANFEEKLKNAGEDATPKKVVQEILEKKTKTVKDGGLKVAQDEEGDGEAGKGKAKMSEKDEGSFDRTKMDNGKVKEKLNKISGKFSNAANSACAISGFLGAANLMVHASEVLQIINLTTALFESVDKAKDGLGAESPINVFATALNERTESEYEILESTGKNFSLEDLTEEGISTLKTTTKKEKAKSAMESAGMMALYNGTQADPNDLSLQSFNSNLSISKRVFGGLGVGMENFKACTTARMTAAAVDAIRDGAEVVACLFGQCEFLVKDTIKTITKSATISLALSSIVSAILPVVTNLLTRDLITNLAGVDLGNALTSGGNMYLGGMHQNNGGSLATMDKYKQFALAKQQVLADNAREERATLSPFDITSQNTFMGTLLTQMMSITHASSFMSTVTSGSQMVSSSIAALDPNASAWGIADDLPDDMEEYSNACPYLASIGAIGDMYCNPLMITDTTTVEDDPVEVIEKVDEYGGFEENEGSGGNVVIKKDSDLSNYILYCGQRNSPFGVADGNIIAGISKFMKVNTGNDTVDTVGDTVIGQVPYIGSIVDLIQGRQALSNAGYVSGESCVAGNEIKTSNPTFLEKYGKKVFGAAFGGLIWSTSEDSFSPGWDKAQYYQRFIEDQSLAESMGLIEKSAVTAFLEEYYEENPIDTSYEGMLAMYSGLDKETVSDVLAILDYANYIADYHPEERYAFGESQVDENKELQFDNENTLAGGVVLIENIIYADVRNRNFVV